MSDLSFNAYQKIAHSTAQYPEMKLEEEKINYIYPVLGLVGESGEIAEKFKKIIRNKNGKITNEDIKAISKELGDVLWYISEICTVLNLELKDIASMNLDKLLDRKNRGVIKSEGDNR